MLSEVTLKILIIGLSFAIAMLAIHLPKLISRNEEAIISYGEPFAHGIFLSVGIFHLLPDAYTGISSVSSLSIVSLIILGIMSLFAYLDYRSAHNLDKQFIPYSLTIILMLHSVIEGAAIGIEMNYQHIWILSTAVLLHKGPAALAYSIALQLRQIEKRQQWLMLILFALATPVGIMAGMYLTFLLAHPLTHHVEAFIDAGLAGAFIYFGAHQLVMLVRETGDIPYKKYIAYLLGFSLILFLN